ncbi:Pecanex-like protein 4 (Pecanex homolog protein 4), partial [Durusdinium trenchii]
VFVQQLEARRQRGKLAETCVVLSAAEDVDAPLGHGKADVVVAGLVEVASYFDDGGDGAGVDLETIKDKRVLLLTFDQTQHFVSPSATSLPAVDGDSLVSLVDFLLDSLEEQHVGRAPPGVWVCPCKEALLLRLPRFDDAAFAAARDFDVNLILTKLGLRKDVESFHRVNADPHTKQVRSIEPPSQATEPERKEGDEQGKEEAAPLIFAGLVHLKFASCKAIIGLLHMDELQNCRGMSLTKDVVKVLSSQCTLDDYLEGESLLEPAERRVVFEKLHGKVSLGMVECRDTVYFSPSSAQEFLELQTKHAHSSLSKRIFDSLGYSDPEIQLPPVPPSGEGGAIPLSASLVSLDRYAARAGSVDSSTSSIASEAGNGNSSDPMRRRSSSRGRVRSRSRSLHNSAHVQVHPEGQITNCLLLGMGVVDEGAAAENCKLMGKWHVHQGSLCIGLRSQTRDLQVPPGVVWQEIAPRSGPPVLVVYKLSDDLHRPFLQHGATFMGMPWQRMLKSTGLEAADLWPDLEVQGEGSAGCTLATARLFSRGTGPRAAEDLARYFLCTCLGQLHVPAGAPGHTHVPPSAMYVSRKAWLASERVSIQQLLDDVDAGQEAAWRRQLSFRIDEFRIVGHLLECSEIDVDFGPLVEPHLRRMAFAMYWKIFKALDEVVINAQPRAQVAALDCIAQALVLFAFVKNPEAKFKRDGPANHPAFDPAFDLIRSAPTSSKRFMTPPVTQMAKLRAAWIAESHDKSKLTAADTLHRLARHYRRAAAAVNQAFVRKRQEEQQNLSPIMFHLVSLLLLALAPLRLLGELDDGSLVLTLDGAQVALPVLPRASREEAWRESVEPFCSTHGLLGPKCDKLWDAVQLKRSEPADDADLQRAAMLDLAQQVLAADAAAEATERQRDARRVPLVKVEASAVTQPVYDAFASARVPFVMQRAAEVVPRWTLQDIRSRCGNATFSSVKAPAPRGSERWAGLDRPQTMPAIEFLDRGLQDGLYLHDESLPRACPALAQEVVIPEVFAGNLLNSVPAELHSTWWKQFHNYWPSLFIGNGETASGRHKDWAGTGAWMAVVEGAKAFTIGDFSGVVSAGDIVFIPGGVPHEVTNLSNLTIAIGFNIVDRHLLPDFVTELKRQATVGVSIFRASRPILTHFRDLLANQVASTQDQQHCEGGLSRVAAAVAGGGVGTLGNQDVAPVFSEYKWKLAVRRVVETWTGGVRVFFPNENEWVPARWVGIQLMLWGLPCVVGAVLFAASSLESFWANGFVFATCCALQIAGVRAVGRWVVRSPKGSGGGLDIEKLAGLSGLLDDDQVDSRSSTKALVRFFFDKIDREPVLAGTVGRGAVGFAVAITTWAGTRDLEKGTPLAVAMWVTLGMALFSVGVHHPVELAQWHSAESAFAPLFRPLHAVLAVAVCGMQVTWFFVVLPVLWGIGLLPPFDALLEWALEQVNVHIFGGTAASSRMRLVQHSALNLVVLVVLWGTACIGKLELFYVVAAVSGFWLSEGVFWMRHQYFRRVRSEVLPNGLNGANVRVMPSRSEIRSPLCHLITGTLAMAGTVIAGALLPSHNEIAEAFAGAAALLSVVDLLCGQASKPFAFQVIRTAAQPLGKPRWSRARHALRDGVRAMIVLGIAQSTKVQTASVLGDPSGTKASTWLVCALLSRGMRVAMTSPKTTSFELCVAVIAIRSAAGSPPLHGTTLSVMALTGWAWQTLCAFWGCLNFARIHVHSAARQPKLRMPRSLEMLSLVCLPTWDVLFAVVAAALDAPLIPVAGTPFFVVGFPRPKRLWPRISSPSSAAAEGQFYAQLLPHVVNQLPTLVRTDQVQLSRFGDTILMMRFEKMIAWLCVLEAEAGYCLVYLKGLELQEPTSCHNVESNALDDFLDHSFLGSRQANDDQQRQGDAGEGRGARVPLNGLVEPLLRTTLRSYSQSTISLTGVIENRDFLRLVDRAFLTSLVWFLSRAPRNLLGSVTQMPPGVLSPQLLAEFPGDWLAHCRTYTDKLLALSRRKVSVVECEAALRVHATARPSGPSGPTGPMGDEYDIDALLDELDEIDDGDLDNDVVCAAPAVAVATSELKSNAPTPGAGEDLAKLHTVESQAMIQVEEASPLSAASQHSDLDARSLLLSSPEPPRRARTQVVKSYTKEEESTTVNDKHAILKQDAEEEDEDEEDAFASLDALDDMWGGPSPPPPRRRHTTTGNVRAEKCSQDHLVDPVIPAVPEQLIERPNSILNMLDNAFSDSGTCTATTGSTKAAESNAEKRPEQDQQFFFERVDVDHVGDGGGGNAGSSKTSTSGRDGARGRSGARRISLSEDTTLMQVCMVCYALVNRHGLASRDASDAGAIHVVDCFQGKFPTTLELSWLKGNVELFELTLLAFRTGFKLALDAYLVGDPDASLCDFDANCASLEDYVENWFVGSGQDGGWAKSIRAEVDHLLSLEPVPKGQPAGSVKLQHLSLQLAEVSLCSVRSKAVHGLWAALAMELYYFTNDDDERYSIQAHPELLRNLVIQ